MISLMYDKNAIYTQPEVESAFFYLMGFDLRHKEIVEKDVDLLEEIIDYFQGTTIWYYRRGE